MRYKKKIRDRPYGKKKSVIEVAAPQYYSHFDHDHRPLSDRFFSRGGVRGCCAPPASASVYYHKIFIRNEFSIFFIMSPLQADVKHLTYIFYLNNIFSEKEKKLNAFAKRYHFHRSQIPLSKIVSILFNNEDTERYPYIDAIKRELFPNGFNDFDIALQAALFSSWRAATLYPHRWDTFVGYLQHIKLYGIEKIADDIKKSIDRLRANAASRTRSARKRRAFEKRVNWRATHESTRPRTAEEDMDAIIEEFDRQDNTKRRRIE